MKFYIERIEQTKKHHKLNNGTLAERKRALLFANNNTTIYHLYIQKHDATLLSHPIQMQVRRQHYFRFCLVL